MSNRCIIQRRRTPTTKGQGQNDRDDSCHLSVGVAIAAGREQKPRDANDASSSRDVCPTNGRTNRRQHTFVGYRLCRSRARTYPIYNRNDNRYDHSISNIHRPCLLSYVVGTHKAGLFAAVRLSRSAVGFFSDFQSTAQLGVTGFARNSWIPCIARSNEILPHMP